MAKVIVFVHGAGEVERNYFKEPLAGLTALLGTEPPHTSIYYADLGNSGHGKKGGKKASSDLDTEEVSNFKAAFSMLVQSDMNALPQSERHAAIFSLPAQFLAELIASDLTQFAAYLFSSRTSNAVQKRVRDGLTAALQLGEELVVASHSLGTVAAFDVLRETDSFYNISTLFTLGSPLSKLRRLNMRSADLGAIPGSVGEWLNLYDTTDPVANALGPMFPTHAFRVRDVFADVERRRMHTHEYFRNPETLAELAAALL